MGATGLADSSLRSAVAIQSLWFASMSCPMLL